VFSSALTQNPAKLRNLIAGSLVETEDSISAGQFGYDL
jgi:hypothetical protein